jgi:hypothetical protein
MYLNSHVLYNLTAMSPFLPADTDKVNQSCKYVYHKMKQEMDPAVKHNNTEYMSCSFHPQPNQSGSLHLAKCRAPEVHVRGINPLRPYYGCCPGTLQPWSCQLRCKVPKGHCTYPRYLRYLRYLPWGRDRIDGPNSTSSNIIARQHSRYSVQYSVLCTCSHSNCSTARRLYFYGAHSTSALYQSCSLTSPSLGDSIYCFR